MRALIGRKISLVLFSEHNGAAKRNQPQSGDEHLGADGATLLTKREEDLLHLVADGLGNRDIARQLNLSENTVKNYMFRIFDKLGVSSRVELVLYALSNSKRAPTSVPADESPRFAARAQRD
jgi:DNA-binding NarL/FixJ family response regulator